MDLNVIKQRLNALNSEQNRGSSDFSSCFWKPEIGKSQVRIVPSKFDKNNPFTELKFHGVKGMFKYPVIALTNFGKQDPIEDFRQQLQQIGGKENWSLSGKLTPKARYFVPVIVRGEEEKGVRLWAIGITIYKALLTLAADEEIGDFTDVVNGTDMIVEKVQGNPYPETAIRAKRNSSPLSEDSKQVEKWLDEQPEPIKCFKEYDYDFIKKQLEAYLTGTPADNTTDTSNPVVEAGEKVMTESKAPVAEMQVKTAAAPKVKATKDVASKFDDLFGDNSDSKDDVDSLGF